MMEEVVVLYLVCKRCGERGCHVEDNRGQGVIPWTRHKALSWCRCKGKRINQSSAPTERKSAARVKKAMRPREAEAQQGSARSGELESATKEGGSQREVRRIFGILREVWLNIGVEKVDMHKGIVTPYKSLGKLSDILHLNNGNNQLERRARPPRNIPLDA